MGCLFEIPRKVQPKLGDVWSGWHLHSCSHCSPTSVRLVCDPKFLGAVLSLFLLFLLLSVHNWAHADWEIDSAGHWSPLYIRRAGMVQRASLHSLAHELVPGLEGPTLEVVSNPVFLLAPSWASPKQGLLIVPTVYGGLGYGPLAT